MKSEFKYRKKVQEAIRKSPYFSTRMSITPIKYIAFFPLALLRQAIPVRTM